MADRTDSEIRPEPAANMKAASTSDAGTSSTPEISEYLHRSFQVVSKHVQTHFGTHSQQCLSQKVRCTHPRFEGAERMFHRLSADP
jgi:hypothetical protein